MIITKRISFESSHYLHNVDWDMEQNIEVYGACSGYKSKNLAAAIERFPVCHGHSYVCEFSIAGEIDPLTGFVINFKELKKILDERIINVFDHNCINDVLPITYQPATVENMIKWIVEQSDLRNDILFMTDSRAELYKIRII